jgi:hypothetical protein
MRLWFSCSKQACAASKDSDSDLESDLLQLSDVIHTGNSSIFDKNKNFTSAFLRKLILDKYNIN